jgi:hypothetical protein
MILVLGLDFMNVVTKLAIYSGFSLQEKHLSIFSKTLHLGETLWGIRTDGQTRFGYYMYRLSQRILWLYKMYF